MLRQWVNIFLTTNHCTFKELCLSEQIEVQGINCIPNNLDDWNRGKHCYSYGSNFNFFFNLITDWLYFFRFIKKMDLNSVLNVTKLLLIEEYFKHTQSYIAAMPCVPHVNCLFLKMKSLNIESCTIKILISSFFAGRSCETLCLSMYSRVLIADISI